MKTDLDKVGGFDERYAKGISYDDDDFLYRVNDKGLSIKIVNDPFVIHQYHPPFTYKKEGWQDLHTINKNLFKSTWL
jgi:GT2 family glycosyltransferase